jgi:hypothetical protein
MRHTLHALAALVMVLFCAQPAAAAPLLDVSGRVSLMDGKPATGSSVVLQVDLDGNGQFAKFETLSAKVKADGAYALRYELEPTKIDLEFLAFVRKLLSDFNARGFDALLERGPLPLMVTIELPGYSTITKRFSALLNRATFDAVLAPLAEINCDGAVCMTPGGSVRIEDFPAKTGITRAYAQAYEPTRDTDRFPGNFSDDEGNLLVSSGFAEINLFDAKGKAINEVAEPVAVRFAMDRASWPTLPDLEPGSGRIELPMYSFDRESGEWTREEDGELQDAEGTPVPEREVEAIRAGRYREEVFVAFRTKHFSTFNCDAPQRERACIKGRLVDLEGVALAGVKVSVVGNSYTGTAGTQITSAAGYFAADVLRSEPEGQDLNRNGQRAEVFSARVHAEAEGFFDGPAFDTPQIESSAQGCKPPQCKCTDLGDIKVEFSMPRLCELKVRATFSGAEVAGSESSLRAGAAVASAQLSASATGSVLWPGGAQGELCTGRRCGHATTDADGYATLTVPVLGASPRIHISATYASREDAQAHYYTGSVTLDGCAEQTSMLEEETEIALSHTQLDGLAAFLSTLLADRDGNPISFCNCRLAASHERRVDPGGLGLALIAFAIWTRRRKR